MVRVLEEVPFASVIRVVINHNAADLDLVLAGAGLIGDDNLNGAVGMLSRMYAHQVDLGLAHLLVAIKLDSWTHAARDAPGTPNTHVLIGSQVCQLYSHHSVWIRVTSLRADRNRNARSRFKACIAHLLACVRNRLALNQPAKSVKCNHKRLDCFTLHAHWTCWHCIILIHGCKQCILSQQHILIDNWSEGKADCCFLQHPNHQVGQHLVTGVVWMQPIITEKV
mmetsp:Transcript_14450/g.42118  ORF Transcript_14450/g.42118 Transcript_14450/m.42118 type:complete len:224 (+) Transcript_14450:495-1166(+)